MITKSNVAGIVSYNFYGGYVNYGAVLQSYALQRALDKMDIPNIIVDYIPEHFYGIHMGLPIKYMLKEGNGALWRWLKNCVPIYRVDRKFKNFKNRHCRTTEKVYTKDNFNELDLGAYVCGSDTIWSIWESDGFDDAFWANHKCMKKGKCIAYSPSFADVEFTATEKEILINRLQNFVAIGVREPTHIEFIRENTGVDVQWTLDPTLLLKAEDYAPVIGKYKIAGNYLLLYSRSRDRKIIEFADRIAQKRSLKVIEISLQIENFHKHVMAYDASVEEFLALVKNADCVVTNSFHGTIFSILFQKDFYTFTRPNCSTKIESLLNRFSLKRRLYSDPEAKLDAPIDYDSVSEKLGRERKKSLSYLQRALGASIHD